MACAIIYQGQKLPRQRHHYVYKTIKRSRELISVEKVAYYKGNRGGRAGFIGAYFCAVRPQEDRVLGLRCQSSFCMFLSIPSSRKRMAREVNLSVRCTTFFTNWSMNNVCNLGDIVPYKTAPIQELREIALADAPSARESRGQNAVCLILNHL